MKHQPRTVLIEDIPVRVRKSRTRSLRLTIHGGGRVSLNLPYFVSYKKGLSFLQKKRQWIIQKQKEFERVSVSFLRQGSREEFSERRDQAFTLVRERLKKFQDFYGISATKIAIRNQKTRWGSCSRTGTLSFSYRLVFLPERLRDYIIVHELCHLREFNHSPIFWKLVGKLFPDYQALRRELKHFGSKEG